jgi:FAD:protein FMN transferase
MPIVKVERPAMGSLFQIFLEGDNSYELERLGYEALDRVDWLEQQLSHYLPDSDISQINAYALKESVSLAPNVTALLARCRQWSLETEGAFDITAGKLVRLWGFFKPGTVHGDAISLPDSDVLAKIVQNIGWKCVELNETRQTIRFHSPEIELHLGAVGKGYIVQAAAAYLREQDVERALLHSGHSSIVALGAPSNAEGWQVALEDKPFLLNNAALSVSSNDETTITVNGKRCGHLFDPRTGLPIEPFGQLAVIAPDATDAEALSTAFAVNGREWSQNYLGTHPEFTAMFHLEH